MKITRPFAGLAASAMALAAVPSAGQAQYVAHGYYQSISPDCIDIYGSNVCGIPLNCVPTQNPTLLYCYQPSVGWWNGYRNWDRDDDRRGYDRDNRRGYDRDDHRGYGHHDDDHRGNNGGGWRGGIPSRPNGNFGGHTNNGTEHHGHH